MKRIFSIWMLLINSFAVTTAQQLNPLDQIQIVADHIISSNSFSYNLQPASKKNSLNELNSIDFGRTFGNHRPAFAYALSWLESPSNQTLRLQIEHNDRLKIFLNDQLVYKNNSEGKASVKIDERNLVLSKVAKLNLLKGRNKILIESETLGERWVVHFLTDQDADLPELGLESEPFISKELAQLSNWLMIGPFSNQTEGYLYKPDDKFIIGTLYDGIDGPVTWTIPKIEILAEAKPIDPIWGSYLDYNYHTAGVAWAMMHLSQATGEKRFDDYARKYTNFMIKTKPFVRYQVEELNEYHSVNYHMIDVPLLDFTLAPALPFVYRLLNEPNFGNRDQYEMWVNHVTNYALNKQVRLNGKHYTRLTPKIYTTWVDDMFMGLPYLMHAAALTHDITLKNQLLNDAAKQVISFNEEVWDEKCSLYQHAQFSDNKVSMPHWSRANGWGVWAVTEVLLGLPEKHPLYNEILNHYIKHVNSLIKYQDKDGFWSNIIDKESEQETSGTAIFTMAIARGINQGWLKGEQYHTAARNGWNALSSVIENDGTVHGICMGTMCSEDLDYYLKRPIVDDDSHGMLGLIMAAIEVQKMLNSTIPK